jgi:5'-nucleotidase
MKMRILISNDDGYQSPGIITLADALREIADVIIVAPDRDRSGASNSLTLDRPLRITPFAENSYYVNGTPTDCVHLALTGLIHPLPDMVVSGINCGPNLGDDVLYSGTVAAAMEGRFLGLPSMAVSSQRPNDHDKTTAQIVKDLVLRVRTHPLPRDTILNVNMPNLPGHLIQGTEVTRLGKRHPSKGMIPAEDPRGHKMYWMGMPGEAQDDGVGTDFNAVNSGKVSITPLHLDLTNYSLFESLAEWLVK